MSGGEKAVKGKPLKARYKDDYFQIKDSKKPEDICKRMKYSDNFITCSAQNKKHIKDEAILKRIEKLEAKIKRKNTKKSRRRKKKDLKRKQRKKKNVKKKKHKKKKKRNP